MPALTFIGAQMAHQTHLMFPLIPGWESMAEQNSESLNVVAYKEFNEWAGPAFKLLKISMDKG